MRIKVRVIRGGLQTSAASGLTSNESGASAAQKLASFKQTEEAFQDPGADQPPPPSVDANPSVARTQEKTPMAKSSAASEGGKCGEEVGGQENAAGQIALASGSVSNSQASCHIPLFMSQKHTSDPLTPES